MQKADNSPMSSQSGPLPEQTYEEITQPKLSEHGMAIGYSLNEKQAN